VTVGELMRHLDRLPSSLEVSLIVEHIVDQTGCVQFEDAIEYVALLTKSVNGGASIPYRAMIYGSSFEHGEA
jgi:hypothetical protein